MTRWTVVVPVKGGPGAKSRLPASIDGVPRAVFAAALAEDTLAAVATASCVARVLVVTAGPVAIPALPHVTAVAQPAGADLDGAVAHASGAAAGYVAVVLGDLPSLRPGDLDEALAAAESGPIAVPDACGTGTTLLAAPAWTLGSAFGEGSFARHLALGYRELDASPRLRADVDTEKDLGHVAGLGLGPATRAALARAAVTLAFHD